MGRIILSKLAEEGHESSACDTEPAAQAYARDLGAKVFPTPGEMAKTVDLILLSLPGPRQIETVVLGEGGLFGGLRPGLVVVDLSTVDPGTTRRMAEAAKAKGAAYLDAPILGRPASIGRWVLPVGGDEKALERCRWVLEIFASKVVRVGPSGAGNILKLLNQLMFSTINGITAEILAIYRKTDLSPQVLFDTVSSSGAATVSGLFCETGRKIVEDDFEPVFSIELLCKDAGLGLAMAKAFGAPPVIAEVVQTYNEIARTTGLAKEDISALVKVYDALYNIDRQTPEHSLY